MKEELHLNLTEEDFLRFEIDKHDTERRGHVGSHIDCYMEAPKKREYVMEVVTVDCRRGLPENETLRALEVEDKALLLYTGNLATNGYGTKEYIMYDMQMTWESLYAILESRPKFILIDSHGMGMFSQHRLFDMEFEKIGCYVIMSLDFQSDEVLDVNRVRIEIERDFVSTGKPCKVFVE